MKQKKSGMFKYYLKEASKCWQLYVLLIPALLWAVIFAYFPMYGVIIAFKDYKIREGILGSPWAHPLFKYFQDFFSTSIAVNAIKNTIIFALLTGPISYVLCFILAWFINDLPRHLRTFMTLVFYAPSLSGNLYMIWQFIFSDDQYGLVNSFLMTFMDLGIIKDPVKWFTDEKYIMIALIIVQLWLSLGAGFLALGAGFKTADNSLYEAGAIDGIKNRFQELIYITIPSMKRQMLFAAVMQISSSFAVGNISIQLCGFPSTNYAGHTIMTHIHDYGTVRYDMGYACALSTLLLIIMLIMNKVITTLLVEKD